MNELEIKRSEAEIKVMNLQINLKRNKMEQFKLQEKLKETVAGQKGLEDMVKEAEMELASL